MSFSAELHYVQLRWLNTPVVLMRLIGPDKISIVKGTSDILKSVVNNSEGFVEQWEQRRLSPWLNTDCAICINVQSLYDLLYCATQKSFNSIQLVIPIFQNSFVFPSDHFWPLQVQNKNVTIYNLTKVCI